MEELDIVKELTETTTRSKSNTHQIDEIKDEIKDIRNENKVLYELTASVKVIAQDMGEVKQGQKDLAEKVDKEIGKVKSDVNTIRDEMTTVANQDNIETGKKVKEFKGKIWFEIIKWLVVSGLSAGITVLITQAIGN